MSKSTIELLAPAGSIESFHAAIDAGADAIYLGFDDFNARGRQKNFTAQTMSHLIPYAQELGKKVYITMNTLIKDGEVPLFVESCNAMKQLKPDAVIVQDLGMAAMLRQYYPNIELHASTQMAVHNSAGFEAMKKMGFTRVVPSRELTLQEIRKINNKTNLEIELFIHGALCYSLSGNCLASSYLGGMSGNRGHCTQVCRRRFSTEGTKSGFYFSPRDFWAIDFVDEYRNIGIKSLKIEGRMRSSEYVFNVTSAYRKFLDGEISVEEAKMRLDEDFGRPKCSFLLNGANSTGIVSAGTPAGTGLFAGKVMGKMGNEITVTKKGEIPEEGDRVRFHSIEGDEGVATKVESVFESDDMVTITVTDGTGFENDGSLFIISRKNPMISKWKKTKVNVEPRILKRGKGVATGRVMAQLDFPKVERKTPFLYIRVDSLEWLKLVKGTKNAKFILSLTEEMVGKITFNDALLKSISGSLILAIPTFIPETRLAFWKENIVRLQKEGHHYWMIGQFGEKELFTAKDTLFADYPVWAMNRFTHKMLKENGIEHFTYSPEDDILNLKRAGNDAGLFPVYMRIPLFTSRVNSVIRDHHKVEDDQRQAFTSIHRDEMDSLISDQPLGLTHRIDKMMEVGINRFILDFSWSDPDMNLFRNILDCYNRRQRIPNSVLFNHKGGMK